MTREQFDAAYASISKSYKEKIAILEKSRDTELRRLEENFRVEANSGARTEKVSSKLPRVVSSHDVGPT